VRKTVRIRVEEVAGQVGCNGDHLGQLKPLVGPDRVLFSLQVVRHIATSSNKPQRPVYAV
jgi:hypothetical protein